MFGLQDEVYQTAKAAGIPFLLYNSCGTEKSDELGGINYVETEDYVAGLAAREHLGKNAAKNVLCVDTVPGAAYFKAL